MISRYQTVVWEKLTKSLEIWSSYCLLNRRGSKLMKTFYFGEFRSGGDLILRVTSMKTFTSFQQNFIRNTCFSICTSISKKTVCRRHMLTFTIKFCWKLVKVFMQATLKIRSPSERNSPNKMFSWAWILVRKKTIIAPYFKRLCQFSSHYCLVSVGSKSESSIHELSSEVIDCPSWRISGHPARKRPVPRGFMESVFLPR